MEQTSRDIIQQRDIHKDHRRMMQVRSLDAESNDMIIEGHPIVFEERTLLFEYDGWKIFEVISRSAMDGANYEDVPLKWAHGDFIITPASTKAAGEKGLITISIEDMYVNMRANLLDTSGGVDLYKAIQAQVIRQMSWAFTIAKETRTEDKEKKEVTYRVEKVDRIFDFAVVDFGAYPTTSIYARRLGEWDERAKQWDELTAERKLQVERMRSNIKINLL